MLGTLMGQVNTMPEHQGQGVSKLYRAGTPWAMSVRTRLRISSVREKRTQLQGYGDKLSVIPDRAAVFVDEIRRSQKEYGKGVARIHQLSAP